AAPTSSPSGPTSRRSRQPARLTAPSTPTASGRWSSHTARCPPAECPTSTVRAGSRVSARIASSAMATSSPGSGHVTPSGPPVRRYSGSATANPASARAAAIGRRRDRSHTARQNPPCRRTTVTSAPGADHTSYTWVVAGPKRTLRSGSRADRLRTSRDTGPVCTTAIAGLHGPAGVGTVAHMAMSPQSGRAPEHVIIVGAGMVGLSTAWFLQQRGVRVTVLERSAVAAGSSWGNAGWITPAMAIPLAEPAVLRYGIKAILDPSAPLYVPPSV